MAFDALTYEQQRERDQLRSAYRRARRALSVSQRDDAKQRFVEHLGALPIDWTLVGVYAAFDGEIDAAEVVRIVAPHAELAHPRVLPGRRLEFVPASRRSAWRRASYGALEPVGEAIAPDQITALVVPALAIDRAGNRLGYGGGYYDRLLAAYPALTPRTLALVYDVQLLDQLEVAAHDRPIRWVVTASLGIFERTPHAKRALEAL